MNKYLPFIVSAVVVLIMLPVAVFPDRPLLLAERVFTGGGIVQVLIVSLYAGFLTGKMIDVSQRAKWRRYSWLLFGILFYSQLLLGITADSLFLMTGKLHLPVPAVIIAGPLYRFSSWFMIILFLSTLLLSGPAWCSHLCYFGAFDAIMAKSKGGPAMNKLRWNLAKSKPVLRLAVLFLVVSIALLLRILKGSQGTAVLLAILFLVAGFGIMIFVSRRSGAMVHCSVWCPVGTAVNYLKYVSPFRFVANSSCTSCMKCIPSCSYMAMSRGADGKLKIGNGCTYCGDCLSSCSHNGLEYRFPGLSPAGAERLWIAVTVILHAVFLAIARV